MSCDHHQETPETHHDPREKAMRYLAKSVLAAAAVVVWSVPGKTAELSWPSFMWGEPNNKPFLTELKKTFETENPGHTIKDITIPIAAFWDKQFADVSSGNPGDAAASSGTGSRARMHPKP